MKTPIRGRRICEKTEDRRGDAASSPIFKCKSNPQLSTPACHSQSNHVRGCGKKSVEVVANCVPSFFSQKSLICEHKLISRVRSRACKAGCARAKFTSASWTKAGDRRQNRVPPPFCSTDHGEREGTRKHRQGMGCCGEPLGMVCASQPEAAQNQGPGTRTMLEGHLRGFGSKRQRPRQGVRDGRSVSGIPNPNPAGGC